MNKDNPFVFDMFSYRTLGTLACPIFHEYTMMEPGPRHQEILTRTRSILSGLLRDAAKERGVAVEEMVAVVCENHPEYDFTISIAHRTDAIIAFRMFSDIERKLKSKIKSGHYRVVISDPSGLSAIDVP